MKNAEIVQGPMDRIVRNIKHAALQKEKAQRIAAEAERRAAEEQRVMAGKFNQIKGLDKLRAEG